MDEKDLAFLAFSQKKVVLYSALQATGSMMDEYTIQITVAAADLAQVKAEIKSLRYRCSSAGSYLHTYKTGRKAGSTIHRKATKKSPATHYQVFIKKPNEVDEERVAELRSIIKSKEAKSLPFTLIPKLEEKADEVSQALAYLLRCQFRSSAEYAEILDYKRRLERAERGTESAW